MYLYKNRILVFKWCFVRKKEEKSMSKKHDDK